LRAEADRRPPACLSPDVLDVNILRVT